MQIKPQKTYPIRNCKIHLFWTLCLCLSFCHLSFYLNRWERGVIASGSCFIFRVGLEQADNTDSAGKEEIQLWPKKKRRWNQWKKKVSRSSRRRLMTQKKEKEGKRQVHVWSSCLLARDLRDNPGNEHCAWFYFTFLSSLAFSVTGILGWPESGCKRYWVMRDLWDLRDSTWGNPSVTVLGRLHVFSLLCFCIF